jgi:thiol:disulfide interchange protein DsbD
LLVDFGAIWCNPCHELDAKTLSDPKVEAELAKYELVKIDVSDPTDEQAAIQAAFHALELPSVVVYAPGAELSEHLEDLRAGQALPKPAVHITTFVEADVFLERLAGGNVETQANICKKS